MNKYPVWKNILLLLIFVVGVLYALPNFFGTVPALQISSKSGEKIDVQHLLPNVKQILQTAEINYRQLAATQKSILLGFTHSDEQFRAQDRLKATLGDNYAIALNLSSAAPNWLRAISALPMKLGLDLQGGIHFLLEVDLNAVVRQRLDDAVSASAKAFRQARLHYQALKRDKDDVVLTLRAAADEGLARQILTKALPGYSVRQAPDQALQIRAHLTEQALQTLRQHTLEQTMMILRNRVNELGVAEAVVQQQGAERIAVDLPGVQDTAQAARILGDTSSLEFHLVDETHDPNTITAGVAPLGTRLYHRRDGRPILIRNDILLYGKSVRSASPGMGPDGKPAVNISTGGEEVKYFAHMTAKNIGKLMAIIKVETRLKYQKVNGERVAVPSKKETIISVASINEGLSYNFQIMGLRSQQEAQDLALILRTGAFIAPVNILQSRLVGPSLGAENIQKGVYALLVGALLVMLFMLVYYRVFGLIANIALLLNVVFLLAILSIVGAVLTLPGIAGIVLTVGMAVDANVLIYERIREELRSGTGPQAAIHAGYERAFTTIIDANLTTLIVGMILFAIGAGAVKGFAVTLSLGLLTSMLTGIVYTRALVNLIYGRRSVKRLAIGN